MINLQLDTSVTFQSAGSVLTALIYTHWPLYLRIHAPSGLNGLTGLHENESSLICRSMSIRNDNNKTLIIDYKIVPVMYPQLNAHTDVNISQLFVGNLYYSPTLLQSQQYIIVVYHSPCYFNDIRVTEHNKMVFRHLRSFNDWLISTINVFHPITKLVPMTKLSK